VNAMTGEAEAAVATVANGEVCVRFRPASPLTLHGRTCWRTDGNSPVRIDRDAAVAFFSRYEPIGHTLRRVGRLVPCGNAGRWVREAVRAPHGAGGIWR
jgi:hypothetical protein